MSRSSSLSMTVPAVKVRSAKVMVRSRVSVPSKPIHQ
jgi:hypothetical protein